MIDLTKRSDMRKVEQAIRNNWQIPEQAFADLPARLLEIVASREGGTADGTYLYPHRLRLSAIRCLVMMQGQVIAAQPQQLDVSVNGTFEFDMATASTMTREEMATVSEAFKLLDGRHNGNGRNGSGGSNGSGH